MRAALSVLLIACLATPTLFGATGTIMPTPYQSVFDTSGNPVSGACVWTYTAGTTTPIATYTDSALLTPNSNPIVADSAGRFVAYLTTGTSYKFTTETACTAPAHGSVIRTVDNVLAIPGTSNPTTSISTVDLRLTLTSGTPVTTADVTAATSVYIEPFRGNRIALYDGAAWNLRTVTATSFSVPAVSNTIEDVFCNDVSATPTYSLVSWTNDTTRSGALTTQDGVLVLSSNHSFRYLGTFRTTAVAGQTEDSNAKRYLFNYYNRQTRTVSRIETTNSWPYTTATVRQANGSTANQVDIVTGIAEEGIALSLNVAASNTGATTRVAVGIGVGSTTTFSSQGGQGLIPTATDYFQFTATYVAMLPVGRQFYSWNEYSVATNVTTWYGVDQIATGGNYGLTGTIRN
jgi:hypothetical protein